MSAMPSPDNQAELSGSLACYQQIGLKIHQSQPLVWPSDLLYTMLAGSDWWISIRSVDNMYDWRKCWKRFRRLFCFRKSCINENGGNTYIVLLPNPVGSTAKTSLPWHAILRMHSICSSLRGLWTKLWREAFKADKGCVPLGWSEFGSVIQDLSGSWCIKGTGESMTQWIRRFLWCTMIQTDLGSLIRTRITPKEHTQKLALFARLIRRHDGIHQLAFYRKSHCHKGNQSWLSSKYLFVSWPIGDKSRFWTSNRQIVK